MILGVNMDVKALIVKYVSISHQLERTVRTLRFLLQVRYLNFKADIFCLFFMIFKPVVMFAAFNSKLKHKILHLHASRSIGALNLIMMI